MKFWTLVWAIVVGLMIYNFIENPHVPDSPITALTWFVIICCTIVMGGLILVVILSLDD